MKRLNLRRILGVFRKPPRERIGIRYRIKHWFTYHPWLKLIGLVLAIMTWFYVRAEISKFNY